MNTRIFIGMKFRAVDFLKLCTSFCNLIAHFLSCTSNDLLSSIFTGDGVLKIFDRVFILLLASLVIVEIFNFLLIFEFMN